MSISYALKRVFKLDFKRAFNQLDKTAEKSGKSKIFIFFDMIWCGLVYGAGPNDYELFEFYNLKRENRKTYITRGINNSLVKRFNKKEYWHFFDNKDEFNIAFAEFMHREFITNENLTSDKFESFCKNKKAIIYKPVDGTCGKLIEKYNLENADINALFENLKNKPKGVIEEVVVQHSEMSRIYPLSVNTVRVVTILKDGICTPVFAFWRIGAKGAYVDNLNSGGMAAMLDLATGKVTLPAADKDGIVYESHPFTNEKIVGFTIPCWDKVLSTVDKASRVIPQIAYVGWDVCVRENDVLLIEGNAYPGHDILQLPAYTPDKIGLKSRVEPFCK